VRKVYPPWKFAATDKANLQIGNLECPAVLISPALPGETHQYPRWLGNVPIWRAGLRATAALYHHL
jgi:hypothetical protein